MDKRLPNLFIVGAARAGTTTLWTILKDHPAIFFPGEMLQKEPAYFSNLRGISDYPAYAALYRDVEDEIYVGDASTAYLTDPASAERIYQHHADARIIIVLRNPVERAYSLYNWMVQEGYEYSCTFQAALKREGVRRERGKQNWLLEPEYFYNYLYTESGRYTEQVARYIERFGREQVFVGLFEDLCADLSRFVRRIYNWLDIEPVSTAALRVKRNASESTHCPWVPFLLRKIVFLREVLAPAGDKRSRDKILKLGRRQEPPPRMSQEVYRRLESGYRGEYRMLEERYGLNLDAWRSD